MPQTGTDDERMTGGGFACRTMRLQLGRAASDPVLVTSERRQHSEMRPKRQREIPTFKAQKSAEKTILPLNRGIIVEFGGSTLSENAFVRHADKLRFQLRTEKLPVH